MIWPLLTAVSLFISSCGLNEKIDVMLECPSPSGKKIATVYRISTGDRPGDQEMKINVRPASSAFDHGMHSFSFRHGYDAVIHWNSDHEIRVEFPASSEITEQEPIIFGTSQTFSSTDTIQMSYQEKPSEHGYFMIEQRCFN
ncbi:MAG: hypothetical protein Q9M08_01125 [Mariprofundus sp.]|nr:hypothetical protein [Mariprofundus sp.]